MVETLLDKRINKDFDELYNSGDGINKLIDDFKKCDLSKPEGLTQLKNTFHNCKISAAEDLSLELFGTPTAFSIHGLPGYFTGNRSARTVMVMLNPGQDVASKDNPGTTQETIELLDISIESHEKFPKTYKEGNAAFGTHDRKARKEKAKKNAKKVYPDNFDLKQAAFLKDWPKDCGVEIPDSFPPVGNKLDNMNYEEVLKTAENVLTQKLQLELVPYASRKFDGIEQKKYKYLFPYIKVLFDEIFSKNYQEEKPRYVIFCSAFFEKLFEAYNDADPQEYPGWIKIIEKKERIDSAIFDKRKVSCSLIKIHRNGKEKNNQGGPSMKAIIAHTFPNQALPNAYDRMKNYGSFCWNLYMEGLSKK